jgi:N-acetylmuramoyl-L-alanine amidase
MSDHRVKQGECILSISKRYGFFWETLWNHPKNSNLNLKRNDPTVLLPGDIVFVPVKEEKVENGSTEQKHRFRRKGLLAYLKIRLLKGDEPRSNLNYKIEIDGTLNQGKTDGGGFIVCSVQPDAQSGKLYLGDTEPYEEYDISFRVVDPIGTDEGIRKRLHNLGYLVDDDLESAVRAFQAKEGVQVTGQVDDSTRTRIKERFGK